MRTRTGPENTILAAALKAVTAVKVEIKNAGGSYVDWFSRLLSVTWGASVDAPIVEARVTLRRDSGQTASLSPFRGDSSLNIGGAAIDAGRDIRISPATSAWGVAPVSGDYKLLFEGKTADIDFANTAMEVLARDLGGVLIQKQIKEESQVRDDTGIALETVIQDLLDTWAPGVSLYTPTSPGFLVTSLDWGKGSLFEAIRTAAGGIGWDIRYLWDDGTSSFRLTLFEPDRTKTTPDWTIAKDRYIQVTQLAIRVDSIRNYVQVSFFNSVSGHRETVFATDTVSVARFGEQWMEIIEADTSPINTTAEAQDLADAALADLAWPIAEKGVELPFFWPVEIGDLIRFTANDIHADDDIDLAVSGYEHNLERGTARTTLLLRGKPAGFYRDWIRRGTGVGPGAPPPAAPLATVTQLTLVEIEPDVMAVSFTLDNAQLWSSYEALGFWPTVDGGATTAPDPIFLRASQQPITRTSYKHSVTGGTWYVIVVPYNSDGEPGTPMGATLTVTGVGGGGALTDIAVTPWSGGVLSVQWSHNAAVEADPTRYVVQMSRNGTVLFASRAARLDPDNTNSLPNFGGYVDTGAVACTSEPGCAVRSVDYDIELTDMTLFTVTYYSAHYYGAFIIT